MSSSLSSTTATSISSDSSAISQLRRPPFLVKRLIPEAILPTKGSHNAAGWDLYSVAAATVPAGGKSLVPTGLSMTVPYGTYGRIAPRSGLASKNFIGIGAGVVDHDFGGQVFVLIFNHGSENLVIKVGDRVAQLVLEKIEVDAELVEVGVLPESVRGEAGFGSTGR